MVGLLLGWPVTSTCALTGDGPLAVATRKHRFPWGAWLVPGFTAAAGGAAAAHVADVHVPAKGQERRRHSKATSEEVIVCPVTESVLQNV
jgi:hypothetical protein